MSRASRKYRNRNLRQTRRIRTAIIAAVVIATLIVAWVGLLHQ